MICEHCGRPTKAPERRFCSRQCGGAQTRVRAIARREGIALPTPPPEGATYVPLDLGFALVDVIDAPRVRQHIWHVALRGGRPYARSSEGIYLHRFVRPNFIEVDHVNGDGLDNRRSNLREGKASLNRRNRIKYAGKSQFKGVCPYRDGRRWRANIKVCGQQIHLGLFATETSAALAYDTAARKHFGAYARLNFPRSGEQPARKDE